MALWKMDCGKQEQPPVASSEAVRETQVRGLGVWNQVMVEEVAKGGDGLYFEGGRSTVAGPDSGRQWRERRIGETSLVYGRDSE